jgi:pimeloyl-ACP methyl ester carboxylesterase
VRFDERGCGMSDWSTSTLGVDQWTEDLESIIAAAKPEAPVTLFGISQGATACINYAVRHPDRVARMILYGGYVHGSFRRGAPESQAAHRAMIELARVAWAQDNPTFRQVFTSRFIPGGSQEQLQWFNDLCLKTTTGDIAAKLFEARADVDIEALLAQVCTPTLVLHANKDEVIPLSEGGLLASGIAGAEFVELESRNHVLLEGEPAWLNFRESVLSFIEPSSAGAPTVFAALSLEDALTAGFSDQSHFSRKSINLWVYRPAPSVCNTLICRVSGVNCDDRSPCDRCSRSGDRLHLSDNARLIMRKDQAAGGGRGTR